MRLTSGERFLIILDDVWEKLDFEAIGIPVGENHKGCTTLITTRKSDVCELMNCERTISLKGLNEDEAWSLFQKHAGAFDDNSNTLKDLAQEITKECGGLPIAIAAVAGTLKGKTQVEWDEALETLRDSSWVDIEEGLKDTYACLRLSYDNLENEVAKSLFLLCSVFPEDYEIPVDLLTIIGMDLGLVGEVHSYKRARNKVIRAKNKLIDCCLLLEVDEGIYVKMHDLVRDVALWIAKKQIKLIMGQERSQKALQKDMIMKDDTTKYLWIDNMDKFSHKLECPELEFLYISIKSKHPMEITNDLFEGMKKLRVFFLDSNSQEDLILQWPKSIHVLNNLCCLFLRGWSVGDISFIGNLEKLESLTLWSCSFDELPKCIIEQKNLRLLDLWRCEIQRNPYEVIGRCLQLQVLYFFQNNGRDWEDQAKSGAEFFDKTSVAPALESYCINLGKNCGDFYRPNFPFTRSLYVEDFETCISNATIKDLIRRAEVLSLWGIHKSCKNIIPNIFKTIGGGMDTLTLFALFHSDKIECVIDATNHLDQAGIFSRLTDLTIKGMKHLKTLCRGQPPHGLFPRLEVIRISSCDSLEHMVADEVEEIVVDYREYERSYRFAFPKLKRLIIYKCNQLEYLMPVFFAQSLAQLEVLNILNADKLKSLFGQSIYEDPNLNKFQIIELSALRKLSLSHLPNIVSICPKNYYPTWPSLRSLELRSCPQLNTMSINPWIASSDLGQKDDQITFEVVATSLKTLQSLIVDDNNKIKVIFHLEVFPNNGQQVNSSLQDLRLYNLPELRHISTGPKNFLCLQNLCELSIGECGNLIVIFPATIVRTLPQLRVLRISNCKELEEIVEDDEENQNLSNPDQILFPNLTAIFIERCHKLKRVFSISTCRVLPKLWILSIEEASQLEQVFGHEKQETIQRKEVVIPNLEYVILRQLPRLMLDLQTVRYLVVLESPGLALTSNITPQELLQILTSEGDAYFDARWDLLLVLENISKSNEDCNRETNKQINSKESGVESASESEHTSSHGQNNDQKLTPVASPNSTENVKESEDQSAQETNISEEKSVKGSVQEGSTSENARIVTPSTHSEPRQIKANQTKTEIDENTGANPMINVQDFEDDGGELPIPCVPIVDTNKDELTKELGNKISASKSSLTGQQQLLGEIEVTNNETPRGIKGVKEPKDQSAQERNISKEKGVQGSVEEDSTLENAKIVTSSAHSKPTSSLLGSLVTSLPIALPHSVKGSFEGSISENAKIVTSSTHSKLASSLPGMLVTSLPKAHPHIQRKIKFNQTETDIDRDIKAIPIINLEDFKDDDLISLLQSMEDDYGGELPIFSVPIVATTKDTLVAEALADLEDSLKMPLKDIVTSEANSLRLQTALNFLSRLSLDDGALSHGLKAIIKSMHQDLPSILYSFKQAFATINKFAVLEERDKCIKEELAQRKEAAIALVSKMSKANKFMNEAQEKETRLKSQISRLEKEIKDCEAELSSLQKQKKKCVAETVEFKKEFETVRKEKFEMVEDQRNARQQLFQVDHKWSALCSQFEQNIAARNLS